AHRWLEIARDVGVPVLTGDPRRGLVRLDDIDLWVTSDQAGCRWMPVQLAKPEAERLVLLHARLLVIEEDDEVLEQRVVHLFHLPVVKRLGKVHAVDFGTNAGRSLAYLYAPVVHFVLLLYRYRQCIGDRLGHVFSGDRWGLTGPDSQASML